MKSRLALLFPWFVFLFIIVVIGIDQTRNRGSENLSPQIARNLDNASVARDPVCHMDISVEDSDVVVYQGKSYYFCTTFCRESFKKDVEKYINATVAPKTHTMHGIPFWMYQWSVAIILLISFGLFEFLNWFQEKSGTNATPTTPKAMDSRWVLSRWKPLQRLLQWAPFTFVLRSITVFCFLMIIAAGLFGNQNPALNIAPLLTWTIWWVGLIFVVLYFGKVWCTICPWDAIATWLERLKFWGPRKTGLGLEMKWPKAMRNIWLAVFLFVGLTWIELGMGITVVPRATAWLALIMLGMAIVSAFLFDRKAFCRYGCLVGRISGLYALFSSTELRVDDPKKCNSCKTMDCYRGNEKGDGCPTFEFPKTMALSTYCILCTECIKTCPQENIVIRQRPWGADLVQTGKPRADEAFLAIILLSMTGFHGLTMTPKWAEWTSSLERAWSLSSNVAFSLLMLTILIAPILLFWSLTWCSSLFSQSHSSKTFFIRYAYALLPIALFYHLAHNAEHFLMEGPKIVALISDPFGWGWNLFGTASWTMTPLITLEGLWWIQVVLILVGHLYSLWISERTTRRLIPGRGRAFLSQLPMLFAMVLFSIFSLWLLTQPMEMRVSSM